MKLLEMHKDGVIKFMGFDDFFLPNQSYDSKRQKLMQHFLAGECADVIRQQILSDEAQKNIYRGMKVCCNAPMVAVYI